MMRSSVAPDCPFCPENGRLSIIRESPSGNTCFVQVLVPHDGEMVLAEGAFFVLPTEHFRPRDDMPFDFLHEVNWHVRTSGLVFDNGGFNYTMSGGAKILDHAHYWLIQVQDGDDQLGLYGLRVKVGREKMQRLFPPGRLDALELS